MKNFDHMFWKNGTFYDGPWRVRCKINMENIHGFFYEVRIDSLFHIVRRWFCGQKLRKQIMVNYKYLMIDYIDLQESSK